MTGRIWIAANQGEVGGGEVMLHHIATALRELGRDAGIVAPAEPAETADRLAADGFPVERLAGDTRAGYMRALRRWHRAHREDVVWCNGLLPSVALAGRGWRIVHLHQVPANVAQRMMVAVARRGSAAVLVPSNFVAGVVRGACVLSNWVPGLYHPAQGSRRLAPLRVGYLGRYSWEKGFDEYLDAARYLAAARPGAYVFSAAGEPRFVEERETSRIAGRLAGSSNVVDDRGWQDASDYLADLDVLVVPSQVSESFGLVAAEAMAAGVVAVVSPAGALPEVVGANHPFVLPAPDSGDIVDCLEDLRRSDGLDELVERQRERWRTYFSPAAGRAAVGQLLGELDI